MTQEQTIKRALRILEARIRSTSTLTSTDAVRDYLRLPLHDRGDEAFVCAFLDAQHQVLASEELFRGTLAQTSVYPREVVKEALAHNAAAMIFAHNIRPAWLSLAGPTTCSRRRSSKPWH